MEKKVAKSTQGAPLNPKPDIAKTFNLWAMAGEIGLKLAIPLLLFMLLGIKIDRALGTTPLFILLGISLSAVISIYFIYRMIQTMNGKIS